MVFKSTKQRKGFFAKVSGEITSLKKKAEQRRLDAIEKETKKLQDLRKKQARTLEVRRKEEQARLEVLKQKQELKQIKDEEKRIKKELFKQSRTGKIVGGIERGAAATGKAVTSKKSKRFFKKLGREIERL